MAQQDRFLNKDAAKALIGATIVAVAGIFLLAWQYNRLAEQRLPEIEARLESQQQELDMQKAKNTVNAFLGARLAGNRGQARQYLTERSVQAAEQDDFFLERASEYEILGAERMEEGVWRFQVETSSQSVLLPQVETLVLIKILEQYYVDSVQLAG